MEQAQSQGGPPDRPISATLKDDLLRELCSLPVGRHGEIKPGGLTKELGINLTTLNALLADFQGNGYISGLSVNHMAINLSVAIKAHDLLDSGGFSVVKAISEANLEKLLFELEHLKKQLSPNQAETANKIATVITAILGALSFFGPK